MAQHRIAVRENGTPYWAQPVVVTLAISGWSLLSVLTSSHNQKTGTDGKFIANYVSPQEDIHRSGEKNNLFMLIYYSCKLLTVITLIVHCTLTTMDALTDFPP